MTEHGCSTGRPARLLAPPQERCPPSNTSRRSTPSEPLRVPVPLRMVKHVLPRDTAVVAYDVDLADRLREILANEPGLVERLMFGGLAFMVAGHMAVSASGQGGLLLRVDPAQTDTLVVDPRASRFVMRGREMDGWLRIDIDARASDDELNRWIKHGVGYARSLPPR